MHGESATQHSDALLSPFLHATSEAESENLLTQLLDEQAGPIIKKIVRSKLDDRLSGQDADDVYCDVVTQLLDRLRLCKTNYRSDAIRDFRNYVAVTTYNACHGYLRSKYPQRYRLKNRVRYLLTHHPDMSLWKTNEGEWLCGFVTWTTSRVNHFASTTRLHQLREDSQMHDDLPRASLISLIDAIFKKVGEPVELEALVNTVADLQGIKDLPVVANLDEHELSKYATSGAPTAFVAELEHRSYLQRLWSEIVQLPLSQRAALLLNLKDMQEGVLMLLPLAGVATIRQIAQAVAIPTKEFAKLWNELPLDDAAVAQRLGVTRQQVINLRKSARARLSRRMRQF